MPDIPLDWTTKFVAAAYLIFLTVLVIYVSIMAVRLRRVQAELRDVVSRKSEEELVRGNEGGGNRAAASLRGTERDG